MSQDLREVLDILCFELNYLEQGGFNRDRKEPGIESPFLGTIACINYGDPIRAHTCHECLLYEFVPGDKRGEDRPCHHIPLNAAGETVAGLLQQNDPERLVRVLESWLRAKIANLDPGQQRNGEA